jgi:GDP-L-fucose synthase
MIQTSDNIYIAGHNGLAGSALVRKFREKGYDRLILRTHAELDLRNQGAVDSFFQAERPDHVILAAATVGGIVANNTRPAEFIYDNLMIQTHVIHAARAAGVKRLIFLGSSCIYPRQCPQPMKEDYLLTGPLEPTNEPYAVAKIAGIKMCQSYNRQYHTRFLAVMPTNLYGINDNFELQSSHVLPALIRKFHEAKIRDNASVTVWGSGTPRREFLHADDFADACWFLLNLPDADFSRLIAGNETTPLINIGCGNDISIAELAGLIGDIMGYSGTIVYDPSQPDGTPQKLLDVSRMTGLGWTSAIPLRRGIQQTYEWCLNQRIFQ